MRVFTALNQKGGVGKSTITINSAAVMADVIYKPREDSDGAQVLAVSSDPQGSAIWWADNVESRGDDGPGLPFQIVQLSDPEQLRAMRSFGGIEQVFVDTPGWIGTDPSTNENGDSGAVLEAVLSVTDLVIVPLPPEPLSFDPTARTIEKVLKPRGIPYIVVINNWDPRDGVADLQQTQALAEAQGWPLARTVIRHYKVHTRAAADGQVCTQYRQSKIAQNARSDFERLCLELTNAVSTQSGVQA